MQQKFRRDTLTSIEVYAASKGHSVLLCKERYVRSCFM